MLLLIWGAAQIQWIQCEFVKKKLREVHLGWLLWRSYMTFLITSHSFITWKIFGAFLWDDVGGVKRLHDYLEIEYSSSKGSSLLGVACVMCIVFTAGYPLFVLYHLFKTDWGRSIGTAGNEVNHILGNLVQDFETSVPMASLLIGVKPSCCLPSRG